MYVMRVTLVALILFVVPSCSNEEVKYVPASVIEVNFSSVYTKAIQAIAESRYVDAVRLFEIVENQAKDLAPRERASYLIQRAQAEAMQNMGDEARAHLEIADSITYKYGLDSLRCLMYNAYGILMQSSDADKYGALDSYIQGMNLARSIGYDYIRAVLSANAAWLFLLDNDMSGLVYAEYCCDYANHSNNKYVLYCGSLTTAQFYIRQGRLNDAWRMLTTANEASKECGIIDLTELNTVVGDYYTAIGNYPKAVESYNKALSFVDVAMPDYTFEAYLNYAEVLLKIGEYKDVVDNIRKGLSYVTQYPLQVQRPRAYRVIADAFERLQMSDSVAYYRNKADIESEAIRKNDIRNVRNNLVTKYERERALALAELQLDNMRERLWFIVLISIVLLVAIVILIISRGRKVKLLKQLVTREVESNKERGRLKSYIDKLQQEKQFIKGLADSSHSGVLIDDGSVSDNDKVLFERIDLLMQKEKLYKDPLIGRDKLADLLQTNRTYISKAINSVTGESVSRYIALYRLNAASEILSDVSNNTPIKDVASELGFTSLSTFYSLFKERYEMSPDKFRKYARERV